MEQIMKLPVDAGNVVLSEDYKSILKNLFSGCRVNFLFGAGFSANLLGTLSNNEVIFEDDLITIENADNNDIKYLLDNIIDKWF